MSRSCDPLRCHWCPGADLYKKGYYTPGCTFESQSVELLISQFDLRPDCRSVGGSCSAGVRSLSDITSHCGQAARAREPALLLPALPRARASARAKRSENFSRPFFLSQRKPSRDSCLAPQFLNITVPLGTSPARYACVKLEKEGSTPHGALK